MGTSNKTKSLNFLGWRSWHPWVCWWWCIGVSTWYLGMPILGGMGPWLLWKNSSHDMYNVQFSMGDSLINWEVTMLRICFAFCCVCVYFSFFKVALSISPWMVSTRVPREGPPRGVIWFSTNPRGSHLQFGSFILWSWMVYIGANHAPWQHGTLVSNLKKHQFLGLGSHLKFQVIKEELSRRYIAIYSSSIGYDSPWLHRHLVLKKHDDRWNHSISAEKASVVDSQIVLGRTAFQHTVMHSAKFKFSRFPTHSVLELLVLLGHIHFSWSRSCLRMDAAFHVFQQWNGGCEWIALAATRHPLSPRIDAFTAFLCLNWQCWKLRWEALEVGLQKSWTEGDTSYLTWAIWVFDFSNLPVV